MNPTQIAIRIAILITLYAIFACIEHIAPAERGHGMRGRMRNIAFMVIFFTIGGLTTAMVFGVLGGMIGTANFAGHRHTALFVFLMLFVSDILFYWYHRLQHQSATLWKLHELHHSDEHLNATTSYRTFWLEYTVQTLWVSIPAFAILGTNPHAVIATMLTQQVLLLFAHANIRIRLGIFTPIIVGPQYHRIHHSVELMHANKNFAQFFPIIDMVFGTYYKPKPNEWPKTGTDSMPSNTPIIASCIRPFIGTSET